MAYDSMITLRGDLADLGFTKDGLQKPGPDGAPKQFDKPFPYEEKKGAVHPGLAKQFPFGRRDNLLNDLVEYCWLVYRKAYDAQGPQLIGRTNDLWVPERLDKAHIQVDKNGKPAQKLWENGTEGNIQVMDKWAPVVNDCWVLGGVHRLANFELVSRRTVENLWNFQAGFHVVTARELLGLRLFGYETVVQGQTVIYQPKDPSLARAATLQAYSSHMADMQAQGPRSVLSLLKDFTGSAVAAGV